MNATHTLDLAFGGEALVEALRLERLYLVAPGGETLFPALDSAFRGLAVLASEAGANPQPGPQRHRLGDHVVAVAPGVAPDALGRLDKVAHHARVVRHLRAPAPVELDVTR